jgi:hypothetical protein
MIKYKLLIIALVGSVLSYYIINLFISPITILQYLGIEIIITIFHTLYNKAKLGTKTN